MKVNRCDGIGSIFEGAGIQNKMNKAAEKVAHLTKGESLLKVAATILSAYQAENGIELNPLEIKGTADEWEKALKLAGEVWVKPTGTFTGDLIQRAVNLLRKLSKGQDGQGPLTEKEVNEVLIEAYEQIKDNHPQAVPLESLEISKLARSVYDSYNALRHKGEQPAPTPLAVNPVEVNPVPPGTPAPGRGKTGPRISVPEIQQRYQSVDGKVVVKEALIVRHFRKGFTKDFPARLAVYAGADAQKLGDYPFSLELTVDVEGSQDEILLQPTGYGKELYDLVNKKLTLTKAPEEAPYTPPTEPSGQ